ncbi:MAG: hypothetical protein WBW88_17480 [Rhodothermales bacterium]
MSHLNQTSRYTLLYLLGVLTLLLPAYMILGERSSAASAESVRDIDPSLDGLDYRIQRLPPQTSQVADSEETTEALRVNLLELRSEFKRLAARRDLGPSLDSTAIELRNRVDDLAIRYMVTSLGQLESKDRFMEAVETRFDDLDRELAALEGSIYEWELRDRFDKSIANLYILRDRVAFQLSEAAASSDPEFSAMKTELASSIGRFDLMIAQTTMEVDHAYDAKHPLQSLNKLWL